MAKKDKTKDTKAAEVKADEAEEEETEAAEVVDEKEAKIKELEEQLAAEKDKYMRLAAEYDNYRKRTANEKLGIYDDATSKAVTEILPVADSVRMAIDKSFEKLKIEQYGKVGDEFDPNLHNAVSMVDSDELKSNQIAQVFQTGYKIGDKIVRHAMVQVVN